MSDFFILSPKKTVWIVFSIVFLNFQSLVQARNKLGEAKPEPHEPRRTLGTTKVITRQPTIDDPYETRIARYSVSVDGLTFHPGKSSQFDSGHGWDVAVACEFFSRFAGEFRYSQFDVGIKTTGTLVEGNVTLKPAMVNVFYRIPTRGIIKPYFYGGGGYTTVDHSMKSNDWFYNFGPFIFRYREEIQNSFQYEAGAGLKISPFHLERWAVNINYEHLFFEPDIKYFLSDSTGEYWFAQRSVNLGGDSLRFGVSYYF